MKNVAKLAAGGLLAFVTVAASSVALMGAANSQPSIPSGTRIDVELTSPLSTSANQKGDPFVAKTEEPIFAKGQEIVPPGSTLRGHVTFVKAPGRLRGKAEMRLVADSILTKDGKQYSFTGELTSSDSPDAVKVKDNEGTVQGPGKDTKKSAEDTGIATAAGAGVGAIADGGTGALYGAGIGAVAEAIHLLAKHHGNIVLHAGTPLSFVLTSPGVEGKPTKGPAVSTPFVCASCQ